MSYLEDIHHCEICKIDLTGTHRLLRCAEHKRCDDCGAQTEDLCHYSDGLFCDACRKKRIEKQIAEYQGNDYCNDLITCPWCGHKITDSWEFNDRESFEHECGECEHTFEVEVVHDVTYTSSKVEK
jgi:hypothetical protein